MPGDGQVLAYALFCNDQDLVRGLKRRQRQPTGERVWRMPLEEAADEYRFALDSEVTDRR